MTRTYHARLSVNDTYSGLLDEFAALYNHIERCLFAETIAQGIKPESVKSAYLVRFGITARQFNAICRNLKGKVESIKELRKQHIEERAQKIKKVSATIKKIQKRIDNAKNAMAKGHPCNTEKLKKDKFSLHQKKRRLHTMMMRQQRHLDDQANNKVRLCFGSRDLFNKQFNLEENKYRNHKQWRKEWRFARNSQFYVLGSKDETAGCQGCVATKTERGFNLRVRLPDALIKNGVKYLSFDVALAYGHDAIAAALDNKQALSYRFMRDRKGWRVLISTDVVAKPVKTSLSVGAIGVDINEHHLAVTEVDRFGNPIDRINIPLSTYGKSSDQAEAVIGDAVKQLMSFADGKQKPVIIEDLDFKKKKQALSSESAKRARQLSSFAYKKIINTIKARCIDNQIACTEVNPAYTSVIGKYKFMRRYGLSSHQAAACAIARRGLKFSEKPNRRDQLASFLPVRNRNEHVWSFWRKVARDKAVSESLSLLSQAQSRRSIVPLSVMSLRSDMAGRACHVSQKNCSSGEILA